MEQLSASEVSNRVGAVMQVLSEEQDGCRVIKRDPDPSKRGGDLYERMVLMASYPTDKYCHSLDVVNHLYKKRRKYESGLNDVYIAALNAICKLDESPNEHVFEDDVGAKQRGSEDDVGAKQGGFDDDVAAKQGGSEDDVEGGHGGSEDDVEGGHGESEDNVGGDHGGFDDDVGEKHGGFDDDVKGGQGGFEDDVEGEHGGFEGDVGEKHGGSEDDVEGEHGGFEDDVEGEHGGFEDDVGEKHGGFEDDVGEEHGGSEDDGGGEHGGFEGDDGEEHGGSEDDVGDKHGGSEDDVKGGQGGDAIVNETLLSTGGFHGPLVSRNLPTTSIKIKGSPNVASIEPWDEESLESDNVVFLSIPENYGGIRQFSRRRTVSRNYRMGKMYALFHDGRIGMSPDEDIQVYVDDINKERGVNLTVKKWMGLIKESVVRKQHRRHAPKTLPKRKGKKRAAETDPYDIDNVSDDGDVEFFKQG